MSGTGTEEGKKNGCTGGPPEEREKKKKKKKERGRERGCENTK